MKNFKNKSCSEFALNKFTVAHCYMKLIRRYFINRVKQLSLLMYRYRKFPFIVEDDSFIKVQLLRSMKIDFHLNVEFQKIQ